LEIRLHNGSKIGNFKIHKRYLTAMGSTVRTVYPFIQFLVAKVGQEKAAEFFKSKKVDPDYFIIQNLPINILIIKDIFDYLNQQGHLSKNNVGEILKVSPVSEIHGYVVSNLKESQSAEINLRRFTKLVQEYYEINSHYHFEGDANSFIQVRDNYHLKDFKLGDEFNMFRMLYNLENYNQLAPVLSGDQEFTVEAVAGGWDLKLK